MKQAGKLFLLIAVCLAAAAAVGAQSRVTGIFENLTANKQSGDLDGMRVMIVSAGTGHHAIVQVAGGGADDPEPVFVDVKVKGNTVEFTAKDLKYTGTVTAAGLRLKDADGTVQVLKRRSCASYF